MLTFSLGPLKHAKRFYLSAIDAAFLKHKARFLPRHFQAGAPERYAPAYDRQGARAVKETAAQRWARMTPAEQAARIKELRAQRNSGRFAYYARNKPSKLPLVASGQLRAAVISGSATFTGAAESRKMSIPTPFYVDFWKPGQFHKKSALAAVTPEEDAAFGQAASTELQRLLDAELGRGA